jgi:hypothetical protein
MNRLASAINDALAGRAPLVIADTIRVGSSADADYPSIDAVPWETLNNTRVEIEYSATPYRSKIAINGNQIEIVGLPGPNGEKPIIDASNATTRRTMDFGRASARETNEARGGIIIVTRGSESGINQPTGVRIAGFALANSHPSKTFVDSLGATQHYGSFGGAIWIDAGHDIRIEGCDISDSAQAIFSRSLDGADATISRDLLVRGCTFDRNGLANNETIHTLYVQSIGLTIEGCHFRSMAAGATGNAIKSRSVGEVIRYNFIECGTYAFDLVEAEDYPNAAMADPAYRVSHVYGNIIDKPGVLAVHYGGDHVGSEASYRKGTLNFWNNTVRMRGARNASGALTEGVVYVFKISTQDETVQAWNNIITFAPDIQFKALRTGQDVAAGYTSGGNLILGVNWLLAGWVDTDPYHPLGGQLVGAENVITGTTDPFDAAYKPLAGSAVLGAATAGLADYPVDKQFDVATMTIVPRASASDLGGEGSGSSAPPANVAPVADFTFTTDGLVASFTDASTDSDGTIVSRAWDFGDGGTSTATNPSHAYAAAGTYAATLTVTDDDGAPSIATRTVTVAAVVDPPPPITDAPEFELYRKDNTRWVVNSGGAHNEEKDAFQEAGNMVLKRPVGSTVEITAPTFIARRTR